MAMKNLACLLILSQITVDVAEVIFMRRTESQSLELSCSPEHGQGSVTGFHLYLSGDQRQTTLLSMAEGSTLRVSPEGRGRLEVSKGPDSPRLNVTISHLRREDTGHYIAEFTYRPENRSEELLRSTQQVLLLVETTGDGGTCPCLLRYPSLLYTIFSAVVLLLLAFIWLATLECTRLRRPHKPRAPVPIYEEMNSKQQGTGSLQNRHEGPTHLEEVDLPMYTNSHSIRQAQDNHYACPRQIALSV